MRSLYGFTCFKRHWTVAMQLTYSIWSYYILLNSLNLISAVNLIRRERSCCCHCIKKGLSLGMRNLQRNSAKILLWLNAAKLCTIVIYSHLQSCSVQVSVSSCDLNGNGTARLFHFVSCAMKFLIWSTVNHESKIWLFIVQPSFNTYFTYSLSTHSYLKLCNCIPKVYDFSPRMVLLIPLKRN